MRRARTWGWARMRRYDDPYNDLGPSSPHQSCPDCIIAMRGYDFREGQAAPLTRVCEHVRWRGRWTRKLRTPSEMHRPFVLHMALKDRWVQAEVNELLERRLSPNPLVAIHKYPGADHAFARIGGKTYTKPEADRALALTLKFFKQHLG